MFLNDFYSIFHIKTLFFKRSSVRQVLKRGRKIKCNTYLPTQELQTETGVSFSPLYKKLLLRNTNPYVFSIWDIW